MTRDDGAVTGIWLPFGSVQVTEIGLHTAMFLTRVHDRLLPTGLAHLAEASTPRRLRTAAAAYQTAIDNLTNTIGLAS